MHVEDVIRTVKQTEVLPCIKCGSEEIDIWNCEYSSFNVAGGTCKSCGNKVKINNCDCDIANKYIAEVWNEANDPKKLKAQYEKQIKELEDKIKDLPQPRNSGVS